MRSLQTADGAVVIERLQGFDNAGKTYSCSIVQAPFPATDYLATIKVEAQGQGARVTWSGRFEPVGVSDEEVVALFTGIYQGGLQALRANYPRVLDWGARSQLAAPIRIGGCKSRASVCLRPRCTKRGSRQHKPAPTRVRVSAADWCQVGAIKLCSTIKHQPRPTQFAAAHLQRKPVQADNRRDDRQAQPEPAFLIARLGAIETLEHRLTLGLRNARAGVEHFDPGMPAFIDPTQNHLATGRGEFDRVAQQVGHRFEQQGARSPLSGGNDAGSCSSETVRPSSSAKGR